MMDLFGKFNKGNPSAPSPSKETQQSNNAPGSTQSNNAASLPAGRRNTSYSVRVREGFKADVREVQARLQLDMRDAFGKCRKVTEGEVMESMLEAYRCLRGLGLDTSPATPLPKEVWQGIHRLSVHHRCPPAQVIEELIARELHELRLVPRKRD